MALDVRDRGGSGEPCLFIHGAVIGGREWEPLDREPALDAYRLISYDRRGFGTSDPPPEGWSIAAEARDAALLIEEKGVAPAHIIGHSYGGSVAIQLAMDRPDVVRSVVLMEPGAPFEGDAPIVEGFRLLATAMRSADSTLARMLIERFLYGVSADPKRDLETIGPDAFDSIISDGVNTLASDITALADWLVSAPSLEINLPLLFVIGGESDRFALEHVGIDLYGRVLASIREQNAHIKTFKLQDTTHMLHLQNPRPLAETLASFFRSQKS